MTGSSSCACRIFLQGDDSPENNGKAQELKIGLRKVTEFMKKQISVLQFSKED